MNKYLLKYTRDMQVETENSPNVHGENIKIEFTGFVNTLELDYTGYTASFCRDAINDKLDKNKLSKNKSNDYLLNIMVTTFVSLILKIKANHKCFFRRLYVKLTSLKLYS